jgi:hypothetical protein
MGQPLHSEMTAVRFSRTMQVLVSIGVFGFGWWATRKGLSISPDSVNYISSGLNLAIGKGLETYSGVPLTQFPPGLPFLVASGHWLGITVQTTGRLVNVLSIAGAAFLAMRIADRYVDNLIQVLLTGCIVGFGFSSIYVATFLWSESLFTLLVLLSFVAYFRLARNPRSWVALAILGATTGSAFTDRYVGVVLIPVFTLALAWEVRNRGRMAIVNLSSRVLISTSVVPTLWVIRNLVIDGTMFGTRPSSLQTFGPTMSSFFRQGLKLLSGTIFVSRVTNWSTIALVTISIGAILVVAWGGMRVLPRISRDSPRPNALVPLSLFVAIYSVYLIYVQLTTALNPFDTRLLSPLFDPFVLVTALCINSPHSMSRHVSLVFRVFIGSTMLVLLLFCQVASSTGYAANLGKSRLEGLARSAFEQAAMKIPSTVDYFTNVGYLLWINHPRDGILDAPTRGAYNSNITYPMPQNFVKFVSCKPTLLVWANVGPNWFYSPLELSGFVSVHVVNRFADGIIYRLGPRDHARNCSK